jgi:proteic killer suppression protein
VYNQYVVKTYKHKGLEELFNKRKSRRVGARYQAKALRCLDLLNQSETLSELNIIGFGFYRQQGKPVRYALSMSGNYRVTFGWAKGAIDIDLEDYH